MDVAYIGLVGGSVAVAGLLLAVAAAPGITALTGQALRWAARQPVAGRQASTAAHAEISKAPPTVG